MGKYDGVLWITDLDGTLLDQNKAISDENKRAIEQFVRMGGKFAVATGRSPASARQWLEQLPINYPCIFYNGSMVKDLQEDRVLSCTCLEREKFLPLIQWVLANSPRTVTEIFTPEGLYVVSDPQVKDPYLEQEKDPYFQAELADIAGQDWIKILLCDEHQSLERVRTKMEEMSLNCVGDSFYSQDFFFEITPRSCTKGTALGFIRRHCSMQGIRIIAVGDYENDIGMLKEADFGVAMGNGQETVRAAADYVTQDHNHHPMMDIFRKIEQQDVFPPQ